jgi:MYXO-CTERM domain-containing protein
MRGFHAKLGRAVVASALIACPLVAANAQTVNDDRDRPGYNDRDRNFDVGWLGLIGLFGLAGLMRRERPHTLVNPTTRSA